MEYTLLETDIMVRFIMIIISDFNSIKVTVNGNGFASLTFDIYTQTV